MALRSNWERRTKGFTLPEVLIVMTLVAALAGVTYIVSIGSLRSVIRRADTGGLLVALLHARAQAINGMCTGGGMLTCTGAVAQGVHIQTDPNGMVESFIVFQGHSFVADDPANAVFFANRALHLSPASDFSEVSFAPFSGKASAAGTMRLVDDQGRSEIVAVGDEGQISWK